jgi:exopolyphosphatase / guanosine-5'-triphosphate,3'-diphosphate pyrophosphatase
LVENSIIAAIDLGSHTIRLLVAALSDGQLLRPICMERRVTRLAQGFDIGIGLTREGMQKSIAVVQEYADLISGLGADSVVCGATGVIRRAPNGLEFLQAIEEQTGIHGAILSEETEATLSAKGVLSGLTRKNSTVLAFDLGGSSTEFTLVDPLQSAPWWATSVFVGAATVTEAYLQADPPALTDLEAATHRVGQDLAPTWTALIELLDGLRLKPADLMVVGTAGTVTTLAAMYLRMGVYQPYRVNSLVLPARWIGDTLRQLAGQTLKERRQWVGLEKDREDIILGGTLIVSEILTRLNRTDLVVTDAGLLEGLLLDSLETGQNWRRMISPFTWDWPTAA